MKILLDTHILLWAMLTPHRLPENIREIVSKSTTTPSVSTASLWEIAIKANIGKLSLPEGFFSQVTRSNINILNITSGHIEAYLNLPLIHKDPFDRMLVAQAQIEQMVIATIDQNIQQYDVEILPTLRTS